MKSRLSAIDHIRQNHSVEHATIHLLSRRHPDLRFVGRSIPSGFLLIGDIGTEAVAEAVMEALDRLQDGESELALHPNCGSNLVVSGVLAGLAAWVATRGRRRSPWDQLPAALLAATAALIIAQPLGPLFQEWVTTTPYLQGVRFRQVVSGRLGNAMSHRVELARD
ncbi:MAG TPA: DUF6391 domain-containing protein [Anaerolineae bacterium]|nr:DUF6391 domain-containing protein [Anaerolineae bacterium]